MLLSAAASFHEVVALASAIAWPAAFVVAVLVLRKPLARVVADLGRRTTRVSAFQVSLEFAALPELSPSEGSGGPFALRTPSPASRFPSGAPALFDEISEPRPADYAVLDLGSGGHWLTSRVFIFSVLLERMRGLRCVVFVETAGDVRRQFVGMATPQQVRWALGRRYPWLEVAYGQAYATALGQHPLAGGAPLVTPPDGMLPAYVANSIASSYLAALFRPAGPGPHQGPAPDTDEWTEIPGYGWEHAQMARRCPSRTRARRRAEQIDDPCVS
jgi:hypothetical protein